MKRELVVIVFGIMLLIQGQSTHANATDWSQVVPITGTRESPGVYRSGEVSDIDASVPGEPFGIATVWGGYFLGGLPRSDTIPTGMTRSVARCPANGNIAVVATGASPSLGGDNWGLGLYHTSDGGLHWQLALQAGPWIGAWRFEKVRWGAGSLVFAASNRGLYRSTGYGMPGSWSVVFGDTRENLPAESYDPRMDVLDIAVDPSSPSTVYIVTGDGRLLRSDYNGSTGTWNQMALPQMMRDGRTPFDRTRIARGTRLAVPKLNPSNVFLMVALPGAQGLYGLFHSTNYGDGHWTADDPGTCRVRPDALMSALAVSPTNSRILLAGGGDGKQVCRSNNGGSRWDALGPGASSIHADHRAVAFSSNGTAYIGTDGGVFASTDEGVNWSSAGNIVLSTPTIQSFDVSAANPAFFYLATWDTGLWANNGGSFWMSTQMDSRDIEADPTNPLRAWATIGLGGEDRFATVDGGVHFDPFNGNLGSAPFYSMIRTNGGSSLVTTHGRAVYSTQVPTAPRPSEGIPAPYWRKWPSARTPDFSGNVLGMTLNRPGNGVLLFIYAWIARNPDHSAPTNKLYVFDTRTFSWRVSGRRSDGTEYFGGTSAIRDIETSANGRLTYAITDDNSMYVSLDYGVSWENVTGNAPPGMWEVLIDPTNPSRLFLSADGGVYQSITPRVWRNWSRGLPFVDGAGAHVVNLRTAVSGGTTYLYAAVLGRGIFRRDVTSDP